MSSLRPAWVAAVLAKNIYGSQLNAFGETIESQISKEVALIAATESNPNAVATAWLRSAYGMVTQQSLVQQVGVTVAKAIQDLAPPASTMATAKEDRLYQLKKAERFVQSIEIARLIVETPHMRTPPMHIMRDVHSEDCRATIAALTKADMGLVEMLRDMHTKVIRVPRLVMQ